MLTADIQDDFWRTRHSLPKDVIPTHITCEFCGTDFKSFGGRKAHREQLHPADQEIRCCGCEALFTRASHMIAHLEQGCCSEITAHEFRASIQHKQIVLEMHQDYGVFLDRTNAYKFERESKPGLIRDGVVEEDEGGVGLLDQEDPQQHTGYEALQPAVDLLTLEEVPHTQTKESWPRLPATQTRTVQWTRSMSITSDTSSLDGSEAALSDVTSRRGGLKVRTESLHTDSWPALNSPVSAWSVSGKEGEDGASDAESDTTVISYVRKPAWSTGKTSKALFKDARPTPAPGDWAAILKRREEDALAASYVDLRSVRFWDASSDEYRPDLFFDGHLYRCPFAQCDEGECQYHTLYELEVHLQNWHLKLKLVCPTCHKRFNTAFAQVAHMESTTKCAIKKSEKYKNVSARSSRTKSRYLLTGRQHFDYITGGFIKVKRVAEPFVIKPEQALVVAGQKPINGVMSHKYEGKLPNAQ